MPEKGVSWDFDADEKSIDDPSSLGSEEPVRRPRTVKFESSPSRPVSVATTDSSPSTGTAMTPTLESRSTDSLHEEPIPSHSSTPLSSHGGDKPLKKSRFVVADTPAASPATPCTPEAVLSPQAVSSPNQGLAPIQTGQQLQGLGVSHAIPDHLTPSEVKKGRFSVNNTSLSVVSPAPSSVKLLPGEPLLSPSRSLSSSPVDGLLEGVRIGTPSEQALPTSGMLLRLKGPFDPNGTTADLGY